MITRYKLIYERKLYVPLLAYACDRHREFSAWSGINVQQVEDIGFTPKQIDEMIELLRKDPKSFKKSEPGNVCIHLPKMAKNKMIFSL